MSVPDVYEEAFRAAAGRAADLERRLATVLEAAERVRDDIKERRVDPYDFGWGGSRNADGSIAYVTVVDDDDPLVAALEQAIKEARGGAFVDSA